jgi:hypothetical protein
VVKKYIAVPPKVRSSTAKIIKIKGFIGFFISTWGIGGGDA